MIERHQDYQLTIPVVPPGGLGEVPLQLDTDAMFSLRAVRSRNLGASGFRFQTADKRWTSNALRTDWVQPTAPGGVARPQRGGLPVYPELLYGTGTQIVCQVGNNTGETLTDVKLLFRGSKWFNDGALIAPTYPPVFSTLDFIYPLVVMVPPATSPTSPGVVREIPLKIDRDADYVIRYGVADPGALGVEGGPVVGTIMNSTGQPINPILYAYQNVYVVLRDESRKAYSNEPIHINDVFGQGRPKASINDGGQDDPVGFLPGLFTPEIYVQAEHSLYVDVYRFDYAPGSQVLPIQIRFGGAKVFASS